MKAKIVKGKMELPSALSKFITFLHFIIQGLVVIFWLIHVTFTSSLDDLVFYFILINIQIGYINLELITVNNTLIDPFTIIDSFEALIIIISVFLSVI